MLSDKDAFYTFLMKQFGLSNLPLYGTIIFIVISLFMISGLIVENIHILSLNKKLGKSEKEVLRLKAKLYDESQQEEGFDLGEELDPDEDSE